jgi:hypothetical protein
VSLSDYASRQAAVSGVSCSTKTVSQLWLWHGVNKGLFLALWFLTAFHWLFLHLTRSFGHAGLARHWQFVLMHCGKG